MILWTIEQAYYMITGKTLINTAIHLAPYTTLLYTWHRTPPVSIDGLPSRVIRSRECKYIFGHLYCPAMSAHMSSKSTDTFNFGNCRKRLFNISKIAPSVGPRSKQNYVYCHSLRNHKWQKLAWPRVCQQMWLRANQGEQVLYPPFGSPDGRGGY